MNAIVKHDQNLIQNQSRMMPSGKELTEFMDTAKMLAMCPYYQKTGAHGILAIWLTAREMGLPPMMCLNGGMYTFSGLVSLSSGLMNMMIINAGHRVNVLQLDEKVCRIQFWRCDRPKGNETFEYEYGEKEAEKAGLLNKDNWKKNRRDMMFNRCLSGGARKFMPDAIMGAYAIGELPGDDAITDTIPTTISIPMSDIETMPPKEYITIEQKEKIDLLLSLCDPKKLSKIEDALKRKSGDKSYEFIQKDCFPKIENFLNEQANKFQQSLQKIDDQEVEDA